MQNFSTPHLSSASYCSFCSSYPVGLSLCRDDHTEQIMPPDGVGEVVGLFVFGMDCMLEVVDNDGFLFSIALLPLLRIFLLDVRDSSSTSSSTDITLSLFGK